MDDTTKKRLKAGGKVVLGAARVVSGIVTASGHGIIGAMCRRNDAMHQAYFIAKHSITGGAKMFREGMDELA